MLYAELWDENPQMFVLLSAISYILAGKGLLSTLLLEVFMWRVEKIGIVTDKKFVSSEKVKENIVVNSM